MTCKYDVRRISIDPSLMTDDRKCWKTWWPRR
jgi:DNA-binding protein YbaB